MCANLQHELSTAWFGIISLTAACLAWASWFLVIGIGLFLTACVSAPLVLVSVIFGLLGIGYGIYDRNLLGIVTSVLGLTILALGTWAITEAMHY